jgi:hypothetical protein
VPEQQPLGHDVASQMQAPVAEVESQRCPLAHDFAAPLWQTPA